MKKIKSTRNLVKKLSDTIYNDLDESITELIMNDVNLEEYFDFGNERGLEEVDYLSQEIRKELIVKFLRSF